MRSSDVQSAALARAIATVVAFGIAVTAVRGGEPPGLPDADFQIPGLRRTTEGFTDLYGLHYASEQEAIEAIRVTFPAGASATFDAATGVVHVRNTQENLARIAQWIRDENGRAVITEKLAGLRVAAFEIRGRTLRETLDLLKTRAAELDESEPNPARRGVNIVLKLDPEAPAGSRRFDLDFHDVTLGEVFLEVARETGLQMSIEPYAVAFLPSTEPTGILLVKSFALPAEIPGFASGPDGKWSALQLKKTLLSEGVEFPAGASISIPSSRQRLVVLNDPENLARLEDVLDRRGWNSKKNGTEGR